MTGNVVVDDIQTEEQSQRTPPPVWLIALGGLAAVVLFLLPGQPEAVPPSSSLTIPEVIVPEDRWERLDLPGAGPLTDVTVLGDGRYVAAGAGPQFWASTGAQQWTLMPADGERPALPSAVTGFAGGAVAVGTEYRGDGSSEAVVWMSTDLEEWQRVTLNLGSHTGLEGVVTGDDLILAWGWRGSAQPFSPAGEALLLASPDGVEWREVHPPSLDARVYGVRPRRNREWWAMGYEIGRPALWSSDDLVDWEAVPTRGLPFGWAMVDLVDPNRVTQPLLATLVDVGDGRIRRWQLEGDGEWTALGDRFGGPSRITSHQVERFGTGAGRLWVLGEDHSEWDPLDVWEALELDGEVRAVAGRVAVGNHALAPSLWVLDGEDTGYVVPLVEGAHWRQLQVLGEGERAEAWPAGEGWIVGASDRWWFVDGARTQEIDPGWSQLWRIDRVGEEWVTVPSMHWSRDGLHWEERTSGWPTDGRAGTDMLAARSDGETIIVVHATAGWNLAVARSGDGGNTWELVAEPAPTTPLWGMVPTADGFAATAARQRNTEEVVTSSDGIEWEALDGVRSLLPTDVPGALTDEGRLLLLDTGEEVGVPRLDIEALVRSGDGLAMLAGGRLWVGPEPWEDVPIDPLHGLAAVSVAPMTIDGRVMVAASDGTEVALYEWTG